MIRRKKLRQAAVLLSAGMLTMTCGSLTAFADNDAAWQYRVDQIKDYMNSPLMQTGRVLAENNKIQYDNRPAVIEDPNKNSVVSFGDSDSVRYTSTSSGTSGTSYGTGPNSQSGTNQVQKSEKPTTQMNELTETYHEDFEVYSESLAGAFFFYSNVGNNGITDQPVYIDLPQNITFTLQKDGVNIPYVSKQTLSEYGTYVLKLIAVKEPDTIDEDPVCYVGTFNFRIQERPAKPKEAETQAASSQASVSSGSSSNSSSYGYPYVSQNYQSDIYANASQAAANAAAGAVVSQLTGSEEGTADGESEASEEGENDEEKNGFSVGEDAIDQMDEEEKEKEQQTYISGKSAAPEQTYDTLTGLYTITYGEMMTMTSSAPNGLLTNNSVSVNKDGLGAYADRVSVLKDGVPYTWPDSNVFEEAGSYVLLIPFTDGTKTFAFHILGTSESEISEYTVPENLELTEVTLDGAIKPVSSYLDEHGVTRLHMEQEGLWQITFSSPEGREYYATLLIDHTPPQLSVNVMNGVAAFAYDSEDVVNFVVNDGKSETSYEALGEWTKPGRYTVTAYDAAGNSTQVSFVLRKKVNPAGFIAAALAALLIAGGLFYVKWTKNNMDVK